MLLVLVTIGNPPGTATRALSTLAHLGALLSVVLAVGLLLAGGWLAPPASGEICEPARRLCRLAAAAAVVGAVAACLHVVIEGAAFLGLPPGTALGSGDFWALLRDVRAYRADVGQAALALLVGPLALAVRRRAEAFVPLALALLCAALPAAAGHAASGPGHVLGVLAISLHVSAAALWVGGLVALAVALPSAPDLRVTVVSRFGLVASCCLVAVAVSGVLGALADMRDLGTLAASGYGRVLGLKVLALLVLGLIGLAHRRRLVRRAEEPSRRRSRRDTFLRLSGVELSVMGVAMGLAAGLGATAPPAAGLDPPSSRAEKSLGFPLDAPPSIETMLGSFHPDPFGLLTVALLGVPYAAGVLRLRRRGDRWPLRRSIAFGAGLCVLLLVTITGVGRYAAALLSVHMLQHMALNMLAPLLLVLGAPVTLALRGLSRDGRRTLLRTVRSRPGRFLTHPLVATAVFVGGLYGVYFTPVFTLAMSSHLGHLLMQGHFLVSGFLYYWMVVGVDPDPRRPPPLQRVPMLVAVMLTHTVFSVVLVFGSTAIGGEYFSSLSLPWARPLLDDQALAGGIAWTLGEFVTVGVTAGLFLQWFAREERADQRELDRRRARLTG